MKIFKLYPYAAYFFAVEGMSLSEAQRIKEENKNRAEALLENLEYDESRAYKKVRTVISASGSNDTIAMPRKPHTIEDFKVLEEVADLRSQSAWLGMLKFIEDIRKGIQDMPNEILCATFGIVPETLQQPLRKQIARFGIDSYCAQDKVEELIVFANAELLAEIGKYAKEALEIEANAAVLGNQYNTQKCLLRKVAKAKDSIAGKDTSLSEALISEEWQLVLDKDKFAAFETDLASKYTELQKQRNSFVKQIKDAARALDLKYAQEYETAVKAWQQAETAFQVKAQTLKSELLSELATLKVKA